MVRISGFYDEVSSDLETQCRFVKELGEEYMCPRVVNGKNIADYTADEFAKDIKPVLDKYGVRFSSIGSPIGKIRWDDDAAYEAQLKKLDELVKICTMMQCKYIRIFSFRMKDGEKEKALPTVITKLKGFLERVKGSDVILIHENEKRIYGDEAGRCVRLYKAMDDPQFKLCYDASNYIQCGYDAWESYNTVKDYCVYFHIKDCSKYRVEVPVGMGEGNYVKLLDDLVGKRGYDGFMTLEPHTGKYADHKVLFQLFCWVTWAVPYISKWHKVFRMIDKNKGLKRFETVDRKTMFRWQYEGLKELLRQTGAENK